MLLIHLPSGVQYQVLQPPRWDAPGPSRGDAVTIARVGWSHDGDKICTDQYVTFYLDREEVMAGLDMGVLTMRMGEKRRFYIPANLAYGSCGAHEVIRPAHHVVFDVELYQVHTYGA